MKFGVRVLPREVILDSQGRAVEKLLKHDFAILDSVRVGKFIEVDVKETDETRAFEEVKKMTEFLLYNPLIEIYHIQRIS